MTREATEGYLRLENDKEKAGENAKKMASMIINGDVNLIGKNAKSLKEEIDLHIKNLNKNIHIDFDDIVNSTIDRFPMSAKSGGICIKGGPIRESRCEKITDELYCAYGMCPNNYYVYFMVDESITEYKLLQNILKHNLDNNFNKAYNKERNKLHWLVNERLIPELEDLKKEIKLKGKEAIITLHPHLRDIINEVDQIYEEATIEYKRKELD